MPHPIPSSPSSAKRRLRAAATRGMGGASSMLRLSRSADARLPTGAALSDWADRAASMLDLTPMMVGPRVETTERASAASRASTRPAPQGLQGGAR